MRVVDVAGAPDLSDGVSLESGVDGGVGNASAAKLVDRGLESTIFAEIIVRAGDGVDREEQDERTADRRQIRPDAILIEPQKEQQRDGKK